MNRKSVSKAGGPLIPFPTGIPPAEFGAYVIEIALTLPLLFLFIFGTLWIGEALSAQALLRGAMQNVELGIVRANPYANTDYPLEILGEIGTFSSTTQFVNALEGKGQVEVFAALGPGKIELDKQEQIAGFKNIMADISSDDFPIGPPAAWLSIALLVNEMRAHVGSFLMFPCTTQRPGCVSCNFLVPPVIDPTLETDLLILQCRYSPGGLSATTVNALLRLVSPADPSTAITVTEQVSAPYKPADYL